MRFNRDIVALLVLLAIFAGGALLLGGRDQTKSRQVGQEQTPDSSVYNDRPSGSRGCFEWVGRLGYKPVVWRQDWAALAHSDGAVLLVIDPRVKDEFSTLTGARGLGDEDQRDKTLLDPADAATLQAWLRAGHTVVLMASRLPSNRGGGPPGDDDSFADALDLVAESASPSGATEFAPLQPTPDTRDVISLHSEADARLKRDAKDGLALFGDRAGPLALAIPVGRGRLVAIADSQFASNANLRRAENAAFLANILARAGRPGAAILFDEYHHGDAELAAGATVWTALGRPLQLSLIQIALAGIVLIAALVVRFGTPVPLSRGLTRTSTEYVTSLAGLYRRAQASTAALETLYRQFLRDVAARLALAPDVNLERLADVAARRGGVDKANLRRLLATCEQRLDEGKVTEPELLDLSRQMDRIRKDIGIV